jgi:3-dehydroquinate synthase
MNNPDLGHIFLYGPPGSGKSTLGRLLAERLALPFVDLDEQIVAIARASIPEIFAAQGEAGFRQLESAQLAAVAASQPAVIALGGGALLDEENRRLAEERGQVVCLLADHQVLLQRLQTEANVRPLLVSTGVEPGLVKDLQQRLAELLTRRKEHYASFKICVDTGAMTVEEAAGEVQVHLGRFRIAEMGQPYDVIFQPGGLSCLGDWMQARRLAGPLVVVSDTNVAGYYGDDLLAVLQRAGYQARLMTIPAGEQYKTLETVQMLWASFLEVGLDRSSTVVALGGGVVGDLAGFAAATYLRGVPWVAAPTTLLAMVDASLGGKTGADLPQGKNLVGAFHPPSLVVADPLTLRSLPEVELRSGMAEVVKAAVIGDPGLFDLCAQGWANISPSVMLSEAQHPDPSPAAQDDIAASVMLSEAKHLAATPLLFDIIPRAMAVKIRYVQDDPFERGGGQGSGRAALNLGHTLGHALEVASDYRLRHGEAVAIGMVAVARYAERIGVAQAGLAAQVAAVLAGLGLPTEIPGELSPERMVASGGFDKKRKGGTIRLVLPVRIGEVQTGYPLESWSDLL